MIWEWECIYGCSSSNYNPFLALKRPAAAENQGEVYGFSLVYSGNFLAQTEVDTYDVSRVMIGIHLEAVMEACLTMVGLGKEI